MLKVHIAEQKVQCVTNAEDRLMEEKEYFKRANFFPGLKATPGFWNGMEEYHFRKEMLYNSLFHGAGVVPDYGQSLHVQAERTSVHTQAGT